MGGCEGQVQCTLHSLLDQYISQGDTPLFLLCCWMSLCWSLNHPLSLCHVICGGHVREVG
jgi:hypothetical protein